MLLTTATNRFLTLPIAERLAVARDNLIATELEIDEDGRFTGRNSGVLNIREGKVERLYAWLQEARIDVVAALEGAVFYSDSANDLPLLRAVGRAVTVDPDARLRGEAARCGWEVLELAR